MADRDRRGRPTLRTPTGERVLDPGDVVCFTAVRTGPTRYETRPPSKPAWRSSPPKDEFGIAEYPDSDKVGVWAGETHYMLRRSAHLEYWDGERH
jgi:hypothetical protein